MTTWRIALMCAFIPVGLGVSSVLVACNNDVDEPYWYPNYTASGYGGAKAAGGAAGTAGTAGAISAGSGGVNTAGATNDGSAGEAGEGGAP